MKNRILTFALSMICTLSIAQGFDSICANPQVVSKKDINKIFKKDVNLINNQLIIYSVNPPTPINWSTPGKAFKSIFRNSFINEGYLVTEEDIDGQVRTYKKSIKTHFIGHMFMELKCAGYPTILTGMSSPGHEEIKGLMIEGKSFTQIISSTKGHFNSAEELQNEIDIRKEKVGNLSYIGVNLNRYSCEELLKYLTEFRACGVDQRYGGLDANPHKGEGAGCSAFAMSFLQRLNIIPMIEDTNENSNLGKEFIRTVIIPKNMLKFDKIDPEIGAWGLLKGNPIQWAKKDSGRVLSFYDPELFSKWVAEYSPLTSYSGLKYLGRDGNNLIHGIWFEENGASIAPSSFSLDYLK
ncbi:MAG: hypothetical protein K2Q18_16310 [Bdellovibrionales bacterium]|nr:hypothetical protein [Bdellovibrionales bacterium]